jgi:hypothetical protein
MKNIAYVVLATAFLLTTFLVTQRTSRNINNPDLSVKYAAIIDEAIAKCLGNAKLLDLKNPGSIHHLSFRTCVERAYLRTHREELVSYLIDVDAVPSRNGVQYYLNKRFYQAFKPNDLYVLLEAGQILNRYIKEAK